MPPIDPRALYESDDTSWLGRPDALVENQWVERKKWCNARDLAEAVCAFANGQPPGGLVVIGATRNGEIVGVSAHGRAVHELVARMRDHVSHPGTQYRFVPARDGADQLLFVWAPFTNDRVTVLDDGSAFIRRGATNRALTRDEIDELRDARHEAHAEDTRLALWDEAEIDAELAAALLAGMSRRNGLTIEQTVGDALRNRGALVSAPSGDALTLAALLAVGARVQRWMPNARLRFQRFEGIQEQFGAQRNVIRDEWFEGPIPRILARFREFMRTQVREDDYYGNDGKFVTEAEYPAFAWEEAVTNALVHRSYVLVNTAVFVRMFDDRIEIESPGEFPAVFAGTEVQKGVRRIALDEPLSSNPRNPRLCGLLQYLEIVRLAREGTKRMAGEMAQMGLPPPEIDEIGFAKVRVTLRNDLERRRRARAAGADIEAEWREIAGGLADGLRLYREDARTRWMNLTARDLLPPAAVLDAAVELLERPDATEEEMLTTLRLIRPELPSDSHRQRLFSLVTGPRAAELANAQAIVARCIAASDVGVEGVVDWLRASGRAAPSDAVAAAFAVLEARVTRSLPDRTWTAQVLGLCSDYGALQPQARALYRRITGRDLPLA